MGIPLSSFLLYPPRLWITTSHLKALIIESLLNTLGSTVTHFLGSVFFGERLLLMVKERSFTCMHSQKQSNSGDQKKSFIINSLTQQYCASLICKYLSTITRLSHWYKNFAHETQTSNIPRESNVSWRARFPDANLKRA